MNTCDNCGSAVVSSRGTWDYLESGLDNVWLCNVEIRECTSCGERSVVIPAITSLHKRIAIDLAYSPQALRASELRFLRKYLGVSRADLADLIGMREIDVTRWESTGDAGRSVEMLLRVLVLRGRPAEEYPVEQLAQLGVAPAAPVRRIAVTKGANGWDNVAVSCVH